MTKQEEIREGIHNITDSWQQTDELIAYLDRNGVVVKVDRECTSDFICDDYMNGLGFLVEHGKTPTYLELDRFIKALGYEAVGELI